jgi:Na+/H+ antiporter NhaD/arsenite permease-like protein
VTQIEKVVESKSAAWLALILGVIGIISHPDVLNILPAHWSAIITFLAVPAQAITKSLFGKR